MSSHLAVFDPDAFYPFRSLVNGPLNALEQLDGVERFVRAAVLHDEMAMVMEPSPDPGLSEEEHTELLGQESRIIIAIGPWLGPYRPLLRSIEELDLPQADIELSPTLIRVCEQAAGINKPGNIYYDAHVRFVRDVLGVVDRGGSALLAGRIGAQPGFLNSSRYPAAFFRALDRDWQTIVKEITDGSFGPPLPPLLAILLRRVKTREEIIPELLSLREEWTQARRKMWDIIQRMRTAETIAAVADLRADMEEAAKQMVPSSEGPTPLRAIWDVTAAGAIGGYMIASATGQEPYLGATAGVIATALGSVVAHTFDPMRRKLGIGAFDLARRIRIEVSALDAETPKLLTRLLTDAERAKLGL